MGHLAPRHRPLVPPLRAAERQARFLSQRHPPARLLAMIWRKMATQGSVERTPAAMDSSEVSIS